MAAGHTVIAVERSPTLARAARTGDPPVNVARGDAAALPFPDGSAGVVAACMVLQDVDDLDSTTHEIARVLKPGGSLCMAIIHPFASAQDPAAFHTGKPSPITDPYFVERRYEDKAERNGLTMTFVSEHRPLSRYVSALTSSGLVVTAMREFGVQAIPWLLVCRAVKLSPHGM
jgi:ubiquinone/menaquinone biosynthesis C-methylase UbiE